MEFNFSINALFKEKIVKVKNNLLPENYSSDRRGDGDVVSKVADVLDKMGVVSAKAQNLPVAITSASKLRNTDHVVYVMTDPDGNKGHGTVVGILKVGSKKLFIYNMTGVQWEMEPLCVLDFYVHESKQRTGCGRLLFDYMLQDQRISPNHLALDQPSESFLSFMCKHYGLDSIIPQMNSFVVYDCFFDGRSDKGRGSSSHGSTGSKTRTTVQSVKAYSRSHEPSTPSYGRHSAKKAGSVMAEYMQDPSLMSRNGNSEYCDEWSTNHQSVPLAQYGHYWSSISGLFSEDQDSQTDGEMYQNGNSSKHRVRKVSNIPMGEDVVDVDEAEPPKLNSDQNDHPFRVGTNGSRDVRIKKTMFQNLSPYRK
ncbi:alpha-tubulin N-acetyltransferase isoform X2 [Frankliniella occidentalis]|uniref:Alpha-tubulin N-acetyltransferase n=1 Tax=Frankliniella occidentalis TaxID=133901 RepID=A0A6J1T7D8_FRAOC|nr:alpha-tubulin N-acetyltransferase isoform X2 [Frankliniella occidentalis]